MVVVTGAVVHEANSAVELMELFERGSASRHVASTKMNSESSRSHLVLRLVHMLFFIGNPVAYSLQHEILAEN